MWPWQFSEFRKVKNISEFRQFCFEPLKKDYYIADIEIVLTQPYANKEFTVKGCVLKNSLEDKPRMIILSNLPENNKSEEIAQLYLNRWPDPEDTFADFSRKIELFTYTATDQKFLPADELLLNLDFKNETIEGLLSKYLQLLDLYVKWHLLPHGYEGKDFKTIREQFYVLAASITKEKQWTIVSFKPESDYAFSNDLEYACRRLNEKEIFLNDNSRLWCRIA